MNDVLNALEFIVALPEGWMAIPVMDTFGGNPNMPKSDSVKLCKGAQSQFDMFTKPLIEITFYGKKQGIMAPKTAYRNVVDLASFATGNHIWTGFCASALMGKELILLWEDTGEYQYQVVLWPNGEDETIGLEDNDVVMILQSISPKTVP